jgi:hypothetical protein
MATYTTLANSKSPNIKCFGRVSIALAIDIRRVRAAFGIELSLLANGIEGRRSPIESVLKYLLITIKHIINAPVDLAGVAIVS